MGRSVVIFGSIPKSNFWRVFVVFLDLVIFANFNAISIDFRKSALFAFILCNFHVYKWENASIKDKYALRILMNISCIYLGEGRGGGLHLCMYIFGNTESAFPTELIYEYLRNLVGMKYSWSLTSVVVFRRGGSRAWQNRSRGSPSFTNFFFRSEGYSNKPNA